MKNHGIFINRNNLLFHIFNKKTSLVGFLFFTLMLFLSLTAEVWSNSKPLILFYKGKYFYPIFKEYHPSQFDMKDLLIVDYKNMKLESLDWVVWPLNQWDPFESNKNVETYPSPPSKQNIFGTDDRGRDVLARLLYGFRASILYAMGVWFVSYVIGVFLGSMMGYYGKWFDLLGMRLIEIMDSIPTLLLLITITSIYTPNIVLLVIITSLFDWTSIATYVRAEFLSLKNREFVEGAKLIGSNNFRIIIKHILPNALIPIVTFSPFKIASSILVLANMDYLGFGLQAPTPSWGELVYQSQKYITVAEWLVWWPSLFLVLTLLSLVSMGLRVRELYGSRGGI